MSAMCQRRCSSVRESQALHAWQGQGARPPRLACMQVEDYLPRRWAARAWLAPPGAPAAAARALSYAFSVSAAVALLNAAPILFLARPASRGGFLGRTAPPLVHSAASPMRAVLLHHGWRRIRWQVKGGQPRRSRPVRRF